MKDGDYNFLFFAVIIAIILGVIGFTYYRRTQAELNNFKRQEQIATVVRADLLSESANIDKECDKADTLKRITYTNDEVVSVLLGDEDLCELVLVDGTSIAYPRNWNATFSKPMWNEISFYYPDYDTSKLPEVTFRKIKQEFVGSLENTLNAFLDSQDAQKAQSAENDLIVSPLTFSSDIKSLKPTRLGGVDVLLVAANEGTLFEENVVYVFASSDNKLWAMIIHDEDFFVENEEVISSIVSSVASSD